MRVVKIFLVGPSGSGKTTTLMFLDKKARLVGEQHRRPTVDEIKAWGLDVEGFMEANNGNPLLVRTSTYPNFGQVIVTYNSSEDKFFINREKRDVSDNSFIVTIVDGCGQQCFYPYREGGAAGAYGILFIFDASRVESYTEKETGKFVYPYVYEIMSAFNELYHFYKKGNVYGPVTRLNPMLPPVVILANKQDIVSDRLKDTKMGRVEFWNALLRSYDPKFFGKYQYPMVECCAIPMPKPYGLEEAIGILFYEIYKRLEIVSKSPGFR
ncbi:MAG: hypothetical protein ACFFG0_07055 [Candidatus Thorarchaeota archaeon]